MAFLITLILLLVACPVLCYIMPGVGLFVSLVVAVGFVSAAIVFEQGIYVLGAPVIFLVSLFAIVVSRREPDMDQWPQFVAKYILTIIGVLLGLAGMSALLGYGGSYGSILFVFFIVAIAELFLAYKHTTAAYIISTIGSIMRQNLPLPMALESAASGRSDKHARILRRIKRWLVEGYSLSESIKRGYPRCPGYAVAMIASAEKINQLPLALKAIEADMVAKVEDSRKVRPVHPLYPIILVTFLFFVVLAIMTFVIPKFTDVIRELAEGKGLPAETIVLMTISNFLHNIGWLLVAAFGFVVLVVIPASIRIRVRPRRPDKPYLISRVGDFIKWHTPLLHWFEKNYSTLRVVELLRLSLNAGCTVNEAIAGTAGLDVNNGFRKRLRNWLAKVESGEKISVAAKQSRLPNGLCWAFDDGINGNTPAILETLESVYRSNYSYRVNLARFIFWPCVTITMGLMVGFVAYAILSPMIATVNYIVEFVIP